MAQSKKNLEDKRKKLIREIELTDKLLKKTTQNKEAAYDRFVTLQNQIERREKLIATINDEITDVEGHISRNADIINSLESDLGQMRVEYGRLIRYALRKKMTNNPLLYILSAANLNQAFRRWLFLRKYDHFRREQAQAIAATQTMLARKLANLESSRTEKEKLLESLQGQKQTLSSELTQKDKMLKNLGKDEDRLKKDLHVKQNAHEELNRAIERIIQEEVRKQVEAARKPAPSKPATPPATASNNNPTKSTNTPTPPKASGGPSDVAPVAAEDGITIDFRKNKGKLPSPVDNGFISRGFGRQKHPTITSVEITNNGIDIRTEEGSPVKAVYAGKVAGVQFIPGHDYTVILQHGNYYTVYSNLSDTALKAGDMVSAKQVIGLVSTNPITDTSELHFELWFQKERLNPASWINQ